MEFHERSCTPCRGGVPPLTPGEAADVALRAPAWELREGASRLVREFRFKNYAEALGFVNAVSVVAEAEGHHPDISFGWGYATVTLYTHAIRGLHENDFLMAAKIDHLFGERARR